jgi:hypothetical protein
VAATLEIRELPQGLSIHVTEPPRMGHVLLIVSAGAAAAFFFLHVTTSSKLVQLSIGGLCAIALIQYLVKGLRGTDVKLLVTDLNLTSTGHATDDYKPSSIFRDEIDNLEFRKASGGGDYPNLPSGLYIKHRGILWSSSTCVLPHIDEAQTRQVIEALYKRFPGIGPLRPTGAFEPHLTSPKLNK